MTTATLLERPVARTRRALGTTWCAACFGAIGGASNTGLYCAACACHRCGEDATGSDGFEGYCARCAAVLGDEGFFG